jgi:hypothetical protein
MLSAAQGTCAWEYFKEFVVYTSQFKDFNFLKQLLLLLFFILMFNILKITWGKNKAVSNQNHLHRDACL